MRLTVEWSTDRYGWDEVGQLASLAATRVFSQDPDFVTIERGPTRMNVKIAVNVPEAPVQAYLADLSEKMSKEFEAYNVQRLKGSTNASLDLETFL